MDNVRNQDMFWFTVYRDILLNELRSFSAAVRRHADPDTNGYELFQSIAEFTTILDTHSDMHRSEAVLFLMNLQFEFDHVQYHDTKTSDVLAHMKNLLYDLTGSHNMNDIRFFCDLRDTFYRSSVCEEAETLDTYIIQKMFFATGMSRLHEHGLTLPYLALKNATFSDEAISRFYCTTKWSVWGSTSICSRLALHYYHDHNCNDLKYMDQMKINRGLIDLLKPFAQPLPESVECVFTMQHNAPYVSIETLKREMSRGEQYNFTTVGETRLEGDAGMRKGTRLLPARLEFPNWASHLVPMTTVDISALPQHIPIILQIGTNAVQGQNICIRVQDFIPTACTNRLHEKLLLVPGLSISCHKVCFTSKLFVPAAHHAVIVKCEFTHSLHDMIQNITEHVISAVHTPEVANA